MGVKSLISRSINPLHESVLEAIGVSEIVRPEEETAERWAKKLCHKGEVDSFELNKNYSILEIIAPEKFVSLSFQQVNFRDNYQVLVLTTIKNTQERSFLGKQRVVPTVQGLPNEDSIIEKDDILVLYGANTDLQKFARLT